MIYKHYHSLIGKTSSLDYEDVEQIFIIYGILRESENVFLINKIANDLKLSTYVDIGVNYGQFAKAVSDSFKSIIVVDANKEALHYASKYVAHDNMNCIHAAVVPSEITQKEVSFSIPTGNTGLGHVVYDNSTANTVPAIHVSSLFSTIDLPKSIVKIDVEGSEPDIIRDIVKSTLLENYPVILFESLNKESMLKVDDLIQEGEFFYIVARYNFISETGLMGDNMRGLIYTLLSGKSTLDLFRFKSLSECDFEFVPLIFMIPKKYEESIEGGIELAPQFIEL